MKLTISIVTFNNHSVIHDALTSIEQSTLKQNNQCRVIVVDNGSSDGTPDLIAREFPDVTLIRSENVGFGAGHNKAIKEITGQADYHLVMNPDIYFKKDALEKLTAFMDAHPAVGLCMPKILYPDGSTQHLRKLLPTPFDLIGRRFIPGFLKFLVKRRFETYEFRDRSYDETMSVPHLSGCFMMIRGGVFREVGGFDERYFMYLEDVDFSRRIHAHYRTLYFPGVYITHHYHQQSYKRFNHLKYHIASAVKYFNKWGWFFDKERRSMNEKAKKAGIKKRG